MSMCPPADAHGALLCFQRCCCKNSGSFRYGYSIATNDFFMRLCTVIYSICSIAMNAPNGTLTDGQTGKTRQNAF